MEAGVLPCGPRKAMGYIDTQLAFDPKGEPLTLGFPRGQSSPRQFGYFYAQGRFLLSLSSQHPSRLEIWPAWDFLLVKDMGCYMCFFPQKLLVVKTYLVWDTLEHGQLQLSFFKGLKCWVFISKYRRLKKKQVRVWLGGRVICSRKETGETESWCDWAEVQSGLGWLGKILAKSTGAETWCLRSRNKNLFGRFRKPDTYQGRRRFSPWFPSSCWSPVHFPKASSLPSKCHRRLSGARASSVCCDGEITVKCAHA